MREKMSKQPPSAPTASTEGLCPTMVQISRMPRHWKFAQHHRTTRPLRVLLVAEELTGALRQDITGEERVCLIFHWCISCF